MPTTSSKDLLLRIGAIAYMCALPLPCLQRQSADGGVVNEPGLAFVLQSLLPQWWLDVPLAFPVFLGNATMILGIALAGITFRTPQRQWWLAVPCLLAAMTGFVVIQVMTPLIGFWFWMIGMTCVGLGAFQRRADADVVA